MRASVTERRYDIRGLPYAVILVVVAVEAVVVLVGFGQSNEPARADGVTYVAYAANLAHHGAFSLTQTAPYVPSVYRMPGYPAFLVPFIAIFGHPLVYVRVAQFVLLAISAALIYKLARVIGAGRVALPSAILCATYLPFVWLARTALSDTLATTLAVCVVLLFCLIRESDSYQSSRRLYLLTAAAGAALTYVRPEFSLFVLLLAAILLGHHRDWTRRQRLSLSGALAVGLVLLLLPWTIRNESVAHAFVPLGAASGDDAYTSALQYSGVLSYKLLPVDYVREAQLATKVDGLPSIGSIDAQQEAERNRRLQDEAWRIFRSWSPTQIARSIPRRLAYLWSTADQQPATAAGRVAHRVAQLQYVAFAILLAIGVVFEARRRFRGVWPLLLLPGYLTALHLVSHEEPRYSVTGRPFLLILIAIGGAAVYDRIARARSRTVAAP
jgi:4-amino-4-deoxy-L-arabinose transferase-like glycosyltransferase